LDGIRFHITEWDEGESLDESGARGRCPDFAPTREMSDWANRDQV